MIGSSKMRWLKRSIQWLVLYLFVISGSIAVTIWGTFILYPIDIHFLNILEQSAQKISFGALMHNYTQLMAYLNFPWIDQLKMTNFSSSANGLQHFADVKQLFILDIVILLISGILAIHFLIKLKQEGKLWQLIRPFQVAVVIPLLIGFLMAMNFDQFFIGFHELFFSNSDWLFDPNVDPIITVLPEDFFMHCFILAVVLLEGSFIWGIIAGKRQLKRQQLK